MTTDAEIADRLEIDDLLPLDDAEAQFQRALKRAPANGWSRYGLAELYKARGNAAQAKKMEDELAKTWIGDRAQLQLSRL